MQTQAAAASRSSEFRSWSSRWRADLRERARYCCKVWAPSLKWMLHEESGVRANSFDGIDSWWSVGERERQHEATHLLPDCSLPKVHRFSEHERFTSVRARCYRFCSHSLGPALSYPQTVRTIVAAASSCSEFCFGSEQIVRTCSRYCCKVWAPSLAAPPMEKAPFARIPLMYRLRVEHRRARTPTRGNAFTPALLAPAGAQI